MDDTQIKVGDVVPSDDRSKPPPGYSKPYFNRFNACWHISAPESERYFTACRATPEEALEHAWANYTRRRLANEQG